MRTHAGDCQAARSARWLLPPAARWSSGPERDSLAKHRADTARHFYSPKQVDLSLLKGIDEFTAGGTALRKELLDVAQRDPHFGCHVGRAEIQIGKTVPDQAVDPSKQLFRMP